MNRTRDIDVIAAEKKRREREYWLNKLSGDFSKSILPIDRKRLTAAGGTYDSLKFELSAELFGRLTQITKSSDSRLFVVLLTGIIVLIHKYTGGDDITVGAPVIKQAMEGKFINTALVLRNRLRDWLSFKDILLGVRQTVVEATEHQNYPLNILQNDLNIPVSPDEFPFFDIVVLLKNIHNRSYIHHIPVNITFSFEREAASIECAIEYNSTLYRRETIERIGLYFRHLLHQGLLDVAIRLRDMDMITPGERERLLHGFNDTSVRYPREETIHKWFEKQAEKCPGQLAIVMEEQAVSYGELHERTNRLSGFLRSRAVCPGSLVGLRMERSIEMIVAMISVLKAGGAYLPISLKWPHERVRYAAEDSRLLLLLTHQQCAQSLPIDQECIDLDDPRLYRDRGVNGNVKVCSLNLAYVIYTSGSTGNPKGVLVVHRNLLNLVVGLQQTIYGPYKKYLRVALMAPYEFDASGQQIYGALLQGHCLCLVSEETRLDGDRLWAFYRERKIDISDGTPSLLRVLLEGKEQRIFQFHAIHFIIAGEVFPPGIAGAFFDVFIKQKPSISNFYGPTETCIDSTYYHIQEGDWLNNDSIPIGQPLPNERVYILGQDGQLAPLGVAGELCIAGDGVSRGYLNNVELTREKFADHTLNGRERMYHTGDLARWREDGHIEFLGRIDQQVKLRGYRIELGEIENLLRQFDGVKDVLVTLREAPAGESQLAAYVVPCCLEDGMVSNLDVTALRHFAAQRLPDYMIPTRFAWIDAFPLTPNGKIDVSALPVPGVETDEKEYVAPRDEVMKKLVKIWSDILGVEASKIGIENDFFELGGHSLKAISMAGRIHKTFDIKIPLLEIFKHPTIAGLWNFIQGSAKLQYDSIRPVEKRDFYPLTSAQKRLFFIHQLDPATTNYNIPLIFRLEGHIDRQRLETIFNELIKRHENLRTSIRLVDGEPVQKVHDRMDLYIQYMPINKELGEAGIQDFIMNEYIKPFDLFQGPLFRVLLLGLRGASLLLMDMHHIVTDGLSQEILRNEFVGLYLDNPLPPLEIQYKDFALWQYRLFWSEIINEQKKFWLDQFIGDLPVLQLPGDYPRPPVLGPEGDYVREELEQALVDGIRRLTSRTGSTSYMVFLAVFNIFLAKYSGQEDIVVGSDIAGRPHADLAPIIGMFVNTLALRNYPRGERGFLQFLVEVKENSLKAFENQDFQFDELVELLSVPRVPNRNPLFDVMFSHFVVETDSGIVDIPGLTVSLYELDLKTVKFDLSLEVMEMGNQIFISFGYSTGLYTEETTRRMMDDLISILRAVTEDSHIKIEDIELESSRFLNMQSNVHGEEVDFGF